VIGNTVIVQAAVVPIILDLPLNDAIDNLLEAKTQTGDAIRRMVNMTMIKTDFDIDYKLQMDENYLLLVATSTLAELTPPDYADLLRALAFYKYTRLEVASHE